jgi:hypothetical protein
MIETRSQPVGPIELTAIPNAQSAIVHLFMDLFAVLIPVLVFIDFEVIGHIYASELALFAFVPFWLYRRGMSYVSPVLKIVLLLGAVWLFGQMMTDFVVGTPFQDYARGWSKILVTLLNLLGLYFLVGVNRRRLMLFAIGLAVGQVMTFYFAPMEYAVEGNEWKFGLAIPITLMAAFLGASWPFNRVPLLPPLFMFGMACANLVKGDRSVSLCCFLTACYLVAQYLFTRRGEMTGRASLKPRIILLASIALAGYGLSAVYADLAQSGALGKDAQTKYELQSEGRYGLFLGGRHEMVVSLQAVSDSPLLGHGSWAKDRHYIDMLYNLRQLGYRTISAGTLKSAYKKGVIPTHSYFFGAWVEGGVAGAVFWGFVMWLVGNILGRLCTIREPLSPLIVYTSVLLGWNILFSPFGGDSRVVAAYTLTLLIFAWTVLERRRKTAEAAASAPASNELTVAYAGALRAE